MKIQIEVTADVRHLYAITTLCAVFDGFYKEQGNKMQDDLLSDMVPALLTLLIILDSAPEGYDHFATIEYWARESESTPHLISAMRRIADRMEVALSE